MIYRMISLAVAIAGINMTGLSQSDWQLEKETNDIRVYLKDTEGNAFKSYRVETTYDARLETVLAVLMDIPNITSYYTTIYDVQDIVDYSPVHADYLLYFQMPWPLKNRFARVESFVEVREDGSVLVSTHQIPTTHTEASLVRVADMRSTWLLEKEQEETTRVIHSGFMDPGGNVPAWLSKKGTIDHTYNAVRNMRTVLPNYKNVKVAFLRN